MSDSLWPHGLQDTRLPCPSSSLGVCLSSCPLEQWSWSSNTLATWCEQPTHWRRPWFWERLRAGGKEGDRGWGGRISLSRAQTSLSAMIPFWLRQNRFPRFKRGAGLVTKKAQGRIPHHHSARLPRYIWHCLWGLHAEARVCNLLSSSIFLRESLLIASLGVSSTLPIISRYKQWSRQPLSQASAQCWEDEGLLQQVFSEHLLCAGQHGSPHGGGMVGSDVARGRQG